MPKRTASGGRRKRTPHAPRPSAAHTRRPNSAAVRKNALRNGACIVWVRSRAYICLSVCSAAREAAERAAQSAPEAAVDTSLLFTAAPAPASLSLERLRELRNLPESGETH